MKWYQKPNVQQAFLFSGITVGIGYILSVYGVIGKGEKIEIKDKYKELDHSNSELYKLIKESEENIKEKKNASRKT